MLSQRLKVTLGGLAVLVGLSGYYIYDAFSTQGEGELAQAPMNIETQIPPAFIMALDDSGSMIWEVLNNTRDGVFVWSYANNGYFKSDGTAYGYSDADTVNKVVQGIRYYYTFPYERGEGNNPGAGIPPIDAFGFARSPQFNPAYFNPKETYASWKNANGTDYVTFKYTAAPYDPRPDPAEKRTLGTVDLTQTWARTDSAGQFTVAKNMVLPKNTSVYAPNNCNASPSFAKTGQWITLTADTKITSTNCKIGIKLEPATFYLTDKSLVPADYGYSADPAEIAATTTGTRVKLYKYVLTLKNFGDNQAKYDAAMQNFANWFSLYRTRREALIGSMTNALTGINQQMRVGWFTINKPADVTMYAVTNSDERTSLYSGFYTIGANSSTPTRQAVQRLGQQFMRTDVSTGSLPIQYSCQKNAGMLFTDGYINDEKSPDTYKNADQDMGKPFADGYSNTMADIAAYYYNTNLREDLTKNDVPVPDTCDTLYDPAQSVANQSVEWKRLDCNSNPHMNFYGITLGTRGAIYEVNTAATDDPFANPPTWAARKDLAPEAVDEMWHATINARGEMVNAKSPSAIADAMRQIIASVGGGASPSGTISLTGSRIGADSFSVVPFYESRNNGTDWYGKLTAQSVSRDPDTRAVTYTTAWEASAALPDPDDRRIYYGTSTGASVFNAGNLTLAALCSNNANGSTMSVCSETKITNSVANGGLGIDLSQAVAYLRGNQALETSTTTPLRSRTTRLGDIVNSAPVISAPTDDYGYRSLYDAGSGKYDTGGYAAYLKAKKTADVKTVYVGANDGMLHAFDGETGEERFGYVPQSVLGHMGNLLFPYKAADKDNQVFQHRYYVDGPVVVSDYSTGGSTWGTAVVATTGAGGKGAFALDVTDPTAFDNTKKLWELNDKSTDTAIAGNIGYVLGKPVIVPVRSTGGSVSWKAIFGNGYNSTNGQAVLFVVDIGSGKVTLIPAGEDGVTGSNGLGNIVVVDRWSGSDLTTATRDGYADTVYAADQKGAIWKFDLRAVTADPANTTTLTKVTTPVFVAQDDDDHRQPILGGLEIAAGPGGGVMLYFGTGGFSFKSDATDLSQQTFYAVLDRNNTATLTRADLLEQEILDADKGITSAYPMPVGMMGWYIDLTANGERFVGNPNIENGVVKFATFDPKSTTGTCVTGGTNWFYGLNALSGAAALNGVRVGSVNGTPYGTGTGRIALTTQGSAPVKDIATMTTSRLAPLSATSTEEDLDNALLTQCTMVIQVAGAPPMYMPRACGRQSWRQTK